MLSSIFTCNRLIFIAEGIIIWGISYLWWGGNSVSGLINREYYHPISQFSPTLKKALLIN